MFYVLGAFFPSLPGSWCRDADLLIKFKTWPEMACVRLYRDAVACSAICTSASVFRVQSSVFVHEITFDTRMI